MPTPLLTPLLNICDSLNGNMKGLPLGFADIEGLALVRKLATCYPTPLTPGESC